MKKIFFLFAALISAMTMSAVTYNVTVPAGTNACYIAGEMTGWSHTEMTKVDDTHYTLELADATEDMKYKYCSGPGWQYVEKAANGDEIADRTYFVEDLVEAWAAVYEPSATPEEPSEIKDITVKAKVPAAWTDQITAWVWPTGGAGSEVVPAQEGEWYVYTHNCTELNIIFKNGAGWNGDANQTVDMTFTADACIEITAGSGKATYAAVDCPESGDTPVEPTPDPETGVTYNVTVPAGTNACYIAGEMNTWSHTEMTKVDETHYTITIAEATTAMKYKYCSGPGWEYVEMHADGVTDVQDRTYAENDVVEAWRAVYTPEGGDIPVDPTPDPETGVTYNVTVPAGTNACYIAGEMNTWSHTEMTKVDETHYTITIAEATTAMKYKYCSGPSWDYVEMHADGVTDVQDRTYAENDVVEAWKAVYTPVDPTPGEVTYVLMGVAGDWTTGIALVANPSNEYEYMLLGQEIAEGDAVKVVTLTDGVATAWCGNVDSASVAHDYDIDGNIILAAGTYDFYYKVAEDLIYIGAAGPVDPTPDPEEPKDITVKAKVPAEWTDPITVWVWATGMEGQAAVPTQEGEWYVYTHTGSELNIIFRNGEDWNGDANQTVDMYFTESACIEITAGSGKATYAAVDCPETEEPEEPTYEYVEDVITNMMFDLENMVIIGGPSQEYQIDVYLPLGEDNFDGSFMLSPESSVAIMGIDATFIEGIAYEIDPYAPAALVDLVVEWEGAFFQLHLTMSAAPIEATVVVVEDAAVEVEKYLLFGDTYDYALKMTGNWYNEADGLTYPVLVEVPVYYPEATEPTSILSTVTVGGWGDTDPWLGFGEGELTVTTVDNVVTATGIAENPWAGIAIDITISGSLSSTPTGVDNIDVEKKAVKVIRDGQMFIIRDNVVYSVLGQVVK